MAIRSFEEGDTPPVADCPGIVLLDPKFSTNVVGVHRLAACFGVPQVWWTGQRVGPDLGLRRKTRLPPEERMRGYGKVDLIRFDRAIEAYHDAGARVVGIEIDVTAESLLEFEHHAPSHNGRIVYVFGPEDGEVTRATSQCDALVQIPAHHCLNLAAAVATVLWDRVHKLWRDHGVPPPELAVDHSS